MAEKSNAQYNIGNKRKYSQLSKKNRNDLVEIGLKGFLCTCNYNEKMCVRESYNILNEYVDKLCNIEKIEPTCSAQSTGDADDLQKEIQSLKSPQQKRFKAVDSGAKNILFVRAIIDDPVKLAEFIVEDIYKTKQQKTRYLLRLIPIEVTCKANLNDIKKAIEPLLDKYFKGVSKSYSIIFNHRNNSQLLKDDVIKAVAEMVGTKREDHKVNLNNAEVSIIIEIIRSFAFLSVVPNFIKYKKYNLHTICTGDKSKMQLPEMDKIETNYTGDDSKTSEVQIPEINKTDSISTGDDLNKSEVQIPEIHKTDTASIGDNSNKPQVQLIEMATIETNNEK